MCELDKSLNCQSHETVFHSQRSRVETILDRARHHSKGTSDVLENAHRWGLKVWALQKFIVWIEQFKAKVGGSLRKGVEK